MTQYNDKLNTYINEISSKMFIFEVTKCCEYSTFVMMSKEENLSDLYNRVSIHFQSTHLEHLYIIRDDNGEREQIPITQLVNIKDYILNRQNIMKPIYPVPDPVVYRIYIQDRTHCEH